MDTIINNFFNTRYDYVLNCANNILKLIKRQDLKYELVNDAYIYIQANQEKLRPVLEEGKIEAVVVRWMTMQIKWSDTQFKKAWVYPNKHHTSSLLEDVESYVILDDTTPEEELLQQEIDIQSQLNHIHDVISNSTLDQQLLYNDVFNLGINTSGKLAKHTGISRTGCYYMIKGLKDKIRTTYKNE